MRDADRDELGRCLVTSAEIMSAYMTLAYDLWIVKDNVRLHARVIDRLQRRSDFAGVRYELLVAATFVRANFAVEPDDETDNRTSHPEFVAMHRETGFIVAVEAKARDRALQCRPCSRRSMEPRGTLASQIMFWSIEEIVGLLGRQNDGHQRHDEP
jgi:hypothetical protein